MLGTLRRDEGGAERFALSLAEAHVAGASVDWQALLRGHAAPSGSRCPPTPSSASATGWTPAAAPPTPARSASSDPGHPLLGAAIEDPDGEGLTSDRAPLARAHPWLADHAVAGTVLLPGTAFVELALRAAEQVGCEAVEELTLEAPLVLAERGAVQLQVARRRRRRGRAAARSRSTRGPRASEGERAEWTCHASGALARRASGEPARAAWRAWPPPGAEPLDVERPLRAPRRGRASSTAPPSRA